jgi:CheY-like chemotaxis protein
VSYSTVVANHLALESQGSIDAEATSDAPKHEAQLSDLKRAVATVAEMLAQPPDLGALRSTINPGLLSAAFLPFAIALAILGIVVCLVMRRLNSLVAAGALAEDRLASLLVEDPSLANFFRELRDGLNMPMPIGGGEPLKSMPTPASEPESCAANDPLEEFFVAANAQLPGLRERIGEISRAADDAACQKPLLEFCQQISELKALSSLPEVRPFWVVASALEGLLKQLSSNPDEVSPSVLGTAAAAVDLLGALSVRGLNPHLATQPPVRLLAVDDDAVSRQAISFALKQVFNLVDLAADGETALGLAARQTYDVIFLDVEMPGMDGYEFCTRIHQTDCHRNTPVVFVTGHGDFATRAKSRLSGGTAFIAKPFLPFEITVKALTLALRSRLEKGQINAHEDGIKAASAGTATLNKALAQGTSTTLTPPVATASPDKLATPAEAATAHDSLLTPGNATGKPENLAVEALFKTSWDDIPNGFDTHFPAHVETLRQRLLAIQHASEPRDLERLLGELAAGVHVLSLEAERAELGAILRLSSVFEAMLKKLVEHPQRCTPSTLSAAAAALDLLDELGGQAETSSDLASAPIRILVVDDDPVTLRAICGSIQLVFGRPDSADNGEAAVALATEKTYDVIFLDVMMPGIDGFTTCSRIRETALNSNSPVVFVTSHDDAEARSMALAAGGCGFIRKPVMASQITLTALTVILRSRLNNLSPACSREETDLAAA